MPPRPWRGRPHRIHLRVTGRRGRGSAGPGFRGHSGLKGRHEHHPVQRWPWACRGSLRAPAHQAAAVAPGLCVPHWNRPHDDKVRTVADLSGRARRTGGQLPCLRPGAQKGPEAQLRRHPRAAKLMSKGRVWVLGEVADPSVPEPLPVRTPPKVAGRERSRARCLPGGHLGEEPGGRGWAPCLGTPRPLQGHSWAP